MDNPIHGFTKVNLSDHEFSKLLRETDPNWKINKIGEFTQYICNDNIVAVVKYKNDPPVERTIFVNNDLISHNLS